MNRSLIRQLFLWGATALIFVSLAGCSGSTPEPTLEGDAETRLTQGRQYLEQGKINDGRPTLKSITPAG